ncbi:hypothetical protein Bca4012_034264 [Brassica carinata]
MAIQIHEEFETSFNSDLREALRWGVETSLLPTFERLCQTMFNQVDVAMRDGINEYCGHTQLTQTLKDIVGSMLSISAEFDQKQNKVLALLEKSAGANPLVTQGSNRPLGPLLRMAGLPVTAELSSLISESKYEEAFTRALLESKSDVNILSWLCSKVDLHALLAKNPLPLSQGLLSSLLQHLNNDISDMSLKLAWLKDVAAAIKPSVQVETIAEMYYQPKTS